MSSTAKKSGSNYILNGEKYWIENSPMADVMIVYVKDEQNTLRGFILERGMNGLETPLIEGRISCPISQTGGINMVNVEVPESQMMPKVKGLGAPMHCVNIARLAISWGVLGAAEDCFHKAVDYSLERKQFDSCIGGYQLVQQKFANIQTEIALALQASLQVSRLYDQGLAPPEMISLIKRNNVIKSMDIARQCRDILGGNGILDSYGVMRHLVNLETVSLFFIETKNISLIYMVEQEIYIV